MSDRHRVTLSAVRPATGRAEADPPATRVFVFPGQGSQRAGMGDGLFARFPAEVKLADSILGYSIERLCLEDPSSQLDRTEFTQPALFVVNALSYLDRLDQEAIPPGTVAGHSLGEYNALFAAGAFDFATGLRLVKYRGALLGRASGGGMAAVVGLGRPQVEAILARREFQGVDIANFNSPKQVVISGPLESIHAAREPFEEGGARMFLPLKVGAAFHSRAMASASAAFRRFIDPLEFDPLKIPVISNVTARPYPPGEVHDLLARQIAAPVLWSESVEYLLRQSEVEFEEIGPGDVLKGLIRQIRAAMT